MKTTWQLARANQPQHMRLLVFYSVLELLACVAIGLLGRFRDGTGSVLVMEPLGKLHPGDGHPLTAQALTDALHRLHPVYAATPELLIRDVAIVNSLLVIPGYAGLLWLVIRMSRRHAVDASMGALAGRHVRYGLVAIAASLDLMQNSMVAHALLNPQDGLLQVGFLVDAVQATNAKWIAVGIATACAPGVAPTTRLGHVTRAAALLAGLGAVLVGLPDAAMHAKYGFPLLLIAWALMAALCVQTAAAHPAPASPP